MDDGAVKEALYGLVDRNMTHHPPSDQDSIDRFESIRRESRELGHAFIDMCPATPELESALRYLELAQMMAVAAIARSG